jgi:hypothetical protein
MFPPLASYGDLQNCTGAPLQNCIGAAGQNSATPSEKVFDFHFIVKAGPDLLTTPGIGGPYFDPSYGLSYADPGDFERKAIDGYAIQ